MVPIVEVFKLQGCGLWLFEDTMEVDQKCIAAELSYIIVRAHMRGVLASEVEKVKTLFGKVNYFLPNAVIPSIKSVEEKWLHRSQVQ